MNFHRTPFLKPPLHFFLPLSLFHLPLLLLPFYPFLFPLHLLPLLLLQPHPAPPIPLFQDRMFPSKTFQRTKKTRGTNATPYLNFLTNRSNFFILLNLSILTLSTSLLPELLLITSIKSTCLIHRKVFFLLDPLFPLLHLLSD